MATAIILPPPASLVRVALLPPAPASLERAVIPLLLPPTTPATNIPESPARVVDMMMMTGGVMDPPPPPASLERVDGVMDPPPPPVSLGKVMTVTIRVEVERVARVEGTAVSYGGGPPPPASLVRVVDMMTMMTGAATPPESPARVDRRDLSADSGCMSGFRLNLANPARVVDMMMTGTPQESPVRVVDIMMMTGTATTITGTPLESPGRVVDILMIIVGGAGRETSLFVF